MSDTGVNADSPLANRKMMNRFDLTQRLVACLHQDEAVVGGIGNTNFDLWMAGHRPQNFYMLGSMGLTCPIALGVAIAQPGRGVVALEGDGSLLMQLSCLSTIGTLRPANPTIADAAVPGKKRSVVISSLQPQFGVKLTIDGAPGPDPGAGMSFLLPDEKAHALTFTCQDRDGNELCVAKTVAIAPGDTEAALDVQLAILPAKLIVEGESNHAYGILEVPNVTLAPGVATDIPMLAGRADRSVTVFDRADPEKGRPAPLRAGQKYVLSFKAP